MQMLAEAGGDVAPEPGFTDLWPLYVIFLSVLVLAPWGWVGFPVGLPLLGTLGALQALLVTLSVAVVWRWGRWAEWSSRTRKLAVGGTYLSVNLATNLLGYEMIYHGLLGD